MTITAPTPPQIKRAAFTFDLKEVAGEAGTFEGYGNVFGVVDWYREVVVKGAFKKTLKDRKASGRPIVLLWQHDPKQPIGTLEAVEDDHGLKVKAKLTLGVKAADEAYLLLKSGALGAMSIGFDVLQDSLDRETGIRYLKEIRLWEVSLVTFPANEASTVTAVKEVPDFATTLQQDELRRLRWRLMDALDTTLYAVMDDETMAAEAKLATINTSLTQFHAAMLDWAGKALAAGVKSHELHRKDPPTTPADPTATEAADPGTPADAKGQDGAGPEPDTPGDDLAAVKALAQQIKAAASEHEALDAIRSLRAAMSA